MAQKMTLSAAAKILGINQGADKNAVNNAYRRLAAKYHPDAWRNSSKEEQERAEQKFKAIVSARKIMFDPTLAAPETVTKESAATRTDSTPTRSPQKPPKRSSRPTSTQQSSQQKTTARQAYNDPSPTKRTPPQTPSAQAEDSKRRAKYNTAKDFRNDFNQKADRQEKQIADIYDEEILKRYKKPTDVFKGTPSMISSIVLFVVSLFSLFLDGNVQLDSIANLINPYTIIAGCCFIKFFAYDLLFSYPLEKLLNGKIGKYALMGLEGLIGSIASIIAIGLPLSMTFSITAIAFLLLFGAFQLAARFSKKNEEEPS